MFFVFCAARALIFLLFTAVACALRRRLRVPFALLAPPLMVACEIAVPQVFPCGQWISQAWHPLVIQIAELTGPWGVTALLMAVNGALVDLIDGPRTARWPLIGAAAALAASLIFGAVRMRQVDDALTHAEWLKIGLVQPNIAYSADGELSTEEAVRELTALQEQSRRLQKLGAEPRGLERGKLPRHLAAGHDRRLHRGLARDDPARHLDSTRDWRQHLRHRTR